MAFLVNGMVSATPQLRIMDDFSYFLVVISFGYTVVTILYSGLVTKADRSYSRSAGGVINVHYV